MKKYFLVFAVSAVFLIIFFSYQTARLSDRQLHVFFCDVGQGDGIFMRTPGGLDIVIDGGPENGEMLKCLSDHMPFWDHEIELVFATHPDSDHIGGLVQVLQNYKVDSFSTSTYGGTNTFNRLKSLISGKNIPFKFIHTGDSFSLSDGVKVMTLWPDQGFLSKDTNPYSLVQLITYGNFRALATGDIPYDILDRINIPPGPFQVFKLPHHGSKTGLDDASLNKIHSSLAIISDGRNNKYHFPHPSVMALLKKYNMAYKRTDQVGTIEVVTDGKDTKVIN